MAELRSKWSYFIKHEPYCDCFSQSQALIKLTEEEMSSLHLTPRICCLVCKLFAVYGLCRDRQSFYKKASYSYFNAVPLMILLRTDPTRPDTNPPGSVWHADEFPLYCKPLRVSSLRATWCHSSAYYHLSMSEQETRRNVRRTEAAATINAYNSRV